MPREPKILSTKSLMTNTLCFDILLWISSLYDYSKCFLGTARSFALPPDFFLLSNYYQNPPTSSRNFISLSIPYVSPLDPFRVGKLQHPLLNGSLLVLMFLIGTIHGSTMEQTRDLERVSPGLGRCEGKPQPLSVRVRLFIVFIHQYHRFPMGSC
jgi:hypothetical protein